MRVRSLGRLEPAPVSVSFGSQQLPYRRARMGGLVRKPFSQPVSTDAGRDWSQSSSLDED